MQTEPHGTPDFNYQLSQDHILKSFFDTSPIMMGIVDLEQNEIRHIIDNQATADFFGRDLSDMKGKLSSEMGVPPEAVKLWCSHYRIAEATMRPVTFEYHFRDRDLSATVNFLGKTDYGNSRFSYVVMDISFLKKSQVRLEEKVKERTREIEKQNAQMEAVFELVSDGVVVFDIHKNIVLVNDAEAKICGFESADEFVQSFSVLVENFEFRTFSDDVIPKEEWPINKIMRGEVVKDLELKGRRRDTKQEWFFKFNGAPVRGSNGEQLLSVCITRDITPYKIAQNKQTLIQDNLTSSESRYRYLFVNNPLPMFVYDKDSLHFLDVNQSALTFYGYRREEFLRLNLKDIRPYGDNYHYRKNGEMCSVEIHGNDMDFNGKKARLVLVNDVTLRDQVEKNLKETVEKLEEALKNVSDYKFALDQASILATTDAAGVITYVNDKFCEVSKYSRDELIGKTHRVVNSGVHSKEFFKKFWDTITRGEVWKGEICNKAKDGSLYWVDTVIVPFLDASGKPYQYVAVRNDITDRKTNLRALEEAINARDEFLSIASHELKTPLTSLKLNNQMAMRHKDQLERFPKYLDQTRRQIQRLIVLVDDMLDISRLATGKLSIQKTEVDLIQLVHETLDRVQDVIKQYGCSVELNLPESCYGVWDKFRIEQVIINLLTNAAKYGSGRPIIVSLGVEDSMAILSIKDFGIGIAQEDIGRIFQRFERAISKSEVSGLGLGLYISCQIVRMHNGSIEVDSKLGEGSTFTVRLPLNFH